MLENGKSAYYLQDDHGSTMCMVDMQREIDALYAYDEFGMPVYKNEKYIRWIKSVSCILRRQDIMIPEQGGL